MEDAKNNAYFVAGLLAARETLARFVEAQDPKIANSIRLNWWPNVGLDPGKPRQPEEYDHLSNEPKMNQALKLANDFIINR